MSGFARIEEWAICLYSSYSFNFSRIDCGVLKQSAKFEIRIPKHTQHHMKAVHNSFSLNYYTLGKFD